MNRAGRLIATAASVDDADPGGILATGLRYLAHAAPTVIGLTIIAPDGTARYVSRTEAERFAVQSKFPDQKATI